MKVIKEIKMTVNAQIEVEDTDSDESVVEQAIPAMIQSLKDGYGMDDVISIRNAGQPIHRPANKLTKAELEQRLVEGKQDMHVLLRLDGKILIDDETCVHAMLREGRYAAKHGKIAVVALSSYRNVPEFGHHIKNDGTLVDDDNGKGVYTLEIFA